MVHVGLRFQPGYVELGAAAHGLRGAIPRAGTGLGEWNDFMEPCAPREGGVSSPGTRAPAPLPGQI
jgi:hypothetical protein